MMKKLFLFDKHVKTSENCNKFSTSVSYETLVGGTTTAGTAYKQAQCLSKGYAGYRFCKTMRFSYENLVETLLQASPVFRLVKILGLAMVLSLSVVIETRAADAPTSGTCGDGCNWSYNTETKELTLSGNGTMDNFTPKTSHDPLILPWNEYIADIKKVKVQGDGLSNIGELAFHGATALTSIEMPFVTEIGDGAFHGATSLTSVDLPNATKIMGAAFEGATSLESVNIPNVTYIGGYAFEGATSLSSVNIPNVTYIGGYAFEGVSLTAVDVPNLKEFDISSFSGYYLRIPDSAVVRYGSSVMDAAAYFAEQGCSNKGGFFICNKCGDRFAKNGVGCVSDCGTGYTEVNGLCKKNSSTGSQVSESDCYANGQVYWDNACVDEYPFAKKHWTPAEAAQFLKDTDNEIIMTFKVNR